MTYCEKIKLARFNVVAQKSSMKKYFVHYVERRTFTHTQNENKMEDIWLKGEQLQEIATRTGHDEITVTKIILDYLIENEIIADDIECAGEWIGHIMDEQHESMYQLVNTKFKIRGIHKKHELGKLISDLRIIAMIDDCPECGCETESHEDGAWGKTWTERKCSHCNFAESGEPDWDLQMNRDE